jgi:hypothetical protein
MFGHTILLIICCLHSSNFLAKSHFRKNFIDYDAYMICLLFWWWLLIVVGAIDQHYAFEFLNSEKQQIE